LGGHLAKITTIFSDIGGVLLTNGWDLPSRKDAAERFALDWNEFETSHESVVGDFEIGRVSLDEYLDCTVFQRPRPFTRDEFRSFLFSESQPQPGSLELVAELAGSGKYLLATLNNESRDLNNYRIERFRLRDYFSVFFSSGFLGVKKPDEKIYRIALEMTQRSPDECLFVDDRAENLEPARRLGMAGIQFHNAAQLREELLGRGVQF
jgi:putative hydrolase of the HAD superfamily